MPTLADAYQRRIGKTNSERRIYIGFTLLILGMTTILLGGLVAVSQGAANLLGVDTYAQQWGIGAHIAGLGLPIALTGMFLVLLTNKRNKALAILGITVMGIGVLLFSYAYPTRWYGRSTDLTWLVFLTYSTGGIISMYTLFRSMLDMEVEMPNNELTISYTTETGETREIPIDEIRREPISTTETKPTATATKETETEPPPDRDTSPGFTGDVYCGNCKHYTITKDESGPYCEFHEEELDDLEACDEHELNMGS